MNFASDLEEILKSQFVKQGIKYNNGLDIGSLLTSYLEMMKRTVHPVPRKVLFSSQIHASLGELLRKYNWSGQELEQAREAWQTVFLLRELLTVGENVNCFLSNRIGYASGKRSKDRFLWDFGMHHFHLSHKELDARGFVTRSGHLLFAIVSDESAYFVDVRPHRASGGVEWVQQDLLTIVHSNWPELVDRNVLHGVLGGSVTDKELKELRRNNVSYGGTFGDKAILPLGGGMMSDGSSMTCRILAMRLLREVREHQTVFESHGSELETKVKEQGVRTCGKPEFELAMWETLELGEEVHAVMKADNCLSKTLYQMGFHGGRTEYANTDRCIVVGYI